MTDLVEDSTHAGSALDLAALAQSITESVAIRPTDRPGYTFAEFEDLTSDTTPEFVDGAIILSPPPIFRHQLATADARNALLAALADVGPDALVIEGPVGLHIDAVEDDPLVVPDIVVVPAALRHDPPTYLRAQHVLVVIEVLSPSNKDKDLVRNVDMYSRAGIAEYWIIDPVSRSVGIYTEPGAAGYHRIETLTTGTIESHLGISLPLNAVFPSS